MFSATMQHTLHFFKSSLYHSYPFYSTLLIFFFSFHNIHPFSDHFSSSFILLLFFLLLLISYFSFSSPSSPLPPHPPLSQSCNTSLTEGFASVILPLLDCDFSFIQYCMYCNIVIMQYCTISHYLNIKFKCGLDLLDELFYIVPRSNHLAILL